MRSAVITTTGVILLGISVDARADSPWVLQAGVGVGVHRTGADYPDAPPPGFSPGAGMQIDAGYRVHRAAALGLHLGAQVFQAPRHLSINHFVDQTYVGIEGGVSGSVLLNRVTLTPWFGVQSLHNKRYRALGVIATYELRSVEHESVALLASVIVNNDWLAIDNWPISDVGVIFGVAYRYW